MPLAPPSVLIVEDNKDAAELFKELLECMDYPAHIATNAQAALQLVQDSKDNNCFSILFIDLNLPDMTGIALSHAIRDAWPECCQKPAFIGMTGLSAFELDQSIIEVCFDHILHKPLDYVQLEQVLSTLTHSDHYKGGIV